MDSKLTNQVNNALREIYSFLSNRQENNLDGLLTGKPGIILLYYLLEKHSLLEIDAGDEIAKFINDSYASEKLRDPSFGSGKSGQNWLYDFFYKNNILLSEDYKILTDDIQFLQNYSLQRLEIGCYDFFFGAIGIAYYSLFNFENENIQYFEEFLDLLISFLDANGEILINAYNFKDNKIEEHEANLGLAHGIPSILKFGIECYKKNICTEKSQKLSFIIIDYILKNKNKNTEFNYFPCHVRIEQKTRSEWSRLGWCYGDLGIGLILYQASIVFNINYLEIFSLNVLAHTTQRRTSAETDVVDAGLCHGSAGIAHFYGLIFRYTNNSLFADARDFWILQTIDYLQNSKDAVLSGEVSKNEIDCSLLNGLAGIGLVLVSYLTGDFSWDYCIMLND